MTKKISNLAFLLGFTTERRRKDNIKHFKQTNKYMVAPTDDKMYRKSDKSLWDLAAKRAIQVESSRLFVDDACYLFDVKESVIFKTDMPEMEV